LSGSNIPLMGRIICLADCFDAMTSNRTYRRALPLEVAITEIVACRHAIRSRAGRGILKTGPDHLRELLRNHAEKSKAGSALQESLLNSKQAFEKNLIERGVLDRFLPLALARNKKSDVAFDVTFRVPRLTFNCR